MLAVIILAAGQGKRMCSTIPKVMHHVAGLPMLDHIISKVKQIESKQIIV